MYSILHPPPYRAEIEALFFSVPETRHYVPSARVTLILKQSIFSLKIYKHSPMERRNRN